jgi:hypothetical protein
MPFTTLDTNSELVTITSNLTIVIEYLKKIEFYKTKTPHRVDEGE